MRRREKKGPAGPFFCSARRRPSGFTLTEVIVVVVILSVLSAVAYSRISGSFATARGAHDQLLAQISYARKAAVGRGARVCVYLDAAQSRLFFADAGGACPAAPVAGTGVPGPDGTAPFRVAVPNGVVVGAATFQFDALGSYRLDTGVAASAPLSIAIAGEDSFQITVEPVTGYVRGS